jgi:hypothetical protein
VTATKGCFPCSIDARLDLGAVCVGTSNLRWGRHYLAESNAVGGPSKEVHRVPSMGTPIGHLSTGNPEDPFNKEERGNGRPGTNVLLNIKRVMTTPAGW